MKYFSKLLVALFLLMAFPQAGDAAFTANKGYNNQTTGSNVNTWGVVLNSNFTAIDNNLGGTLTLSVAGSSNVTLTQAQSQNLIYNFTGVLTGNINVIFPAAGGLYFINNQTTGAYTLTIKAGTSTANITVPQGQSVPVVVDNSTSPPTVDGAIGTVPAYTSLTVGGSANAITVSLTSPPNFTLVTGTTLWFIPASLNTSSTVTFTTPDGSTKNIKAVSPGGLINIPVEYLVPGNPQLMYYDGTEWVDITTVYFGTPIVVSTNQAVSSTTTFADYVATSAVNLTISRTATTLPPFWWIEVNALGGAVTITPDSHDSINVNGRTLAANTAYVLPQGVTAKISTDVNGNLYVMFNGNLLNTESTLASATSTDLGTMASNIGSITGTTTITGFGSSASTANPLYFLRFSGALTLTYNATSLILPGAANIATVAGDTAIVEYLGSGNWQVLNYAPASGTAVVSSGLDAVGYGISNTGGTIALNPTTANNTLGGNVTMTTAGTYYDGPSMAQGTSGTWFVTGCVVVTNSGSSAYRAELWDGTTVFDSAQASLSTFSGGVTTRICLSAIVTNPAANLKISATNITNSGGSIQSNASGFGHDSQIQGVRIK